MKKVLMKRILLRTIWRMKILTIYHFQLSKDKKSHYEEYEEIAAKKYPWEKQKEDKPRLSKYTDLDKDTDEGKSNHKNKDIKRLKKWRK